MVRDATGWALRWRKGSQAKEWGQHSEAGKGQRNRFTPELPERNSAYRGVLLETTNCAVICYSSNRKWIQKLFLKSYGSLRATREGTCQRSGFRNPHSLFLAEIKQTYPISHMSCILPPGLRCSLNYFPFFKMFPLNHILDKTPLEKSHFATAVPWCGGPRTPAQHWGCSHVFCSVLLCFCPPGTHSPRLCYLLQLATHSLMAGLKSLLLMGCPCALHPVSTQWTRPAYVSDFLGREQCILSWA